MMPEYLILYFMAICLLMIAFDIAFVIFERARDARERALVDSLAERLGAGAGEDGDALAGVAQDELVSMCSGLAGMEALDRALEAASGGDARDAASIDRLVAGALDRAALADGARGDLERAFFAHLVRRWYRVSPPGEAVVGCLRSDLLSASLYVRQNAFEALAEVASAAEVAGALRVLDARGGAHNPRLVTEALLASTVDAAELARELDAALEELGPLTAAAAINYLRMSGTGDARHLLAIMADEGADREVRLACIRYFMRRPHRDALQVLLGFCAIQDASMWEFVAVSAMALSAYPGEGTVRVLKGLLASSSWFVRYNAAKSLYDLGCTLEGELADVLAVGDRFACDMLRYRWQLEEQMRGEGAHA